MAKKIRQMDEVPVDVFEAIKRARMRLGFVRRRGVSQNGAGEAKNEEKDHDSQPENKVSKDTEKKPDDEVTKESEPTPDDASSGGADEDPEKLLDITTNAHDILFEAHTVFPFTLFPDTVTVDREKVTIANRSFFRVAVINSTPIADIQSVEVDVGPFFGTVKTTSKYFMNNPREVHFLWREDAVKMQRLLQGYIIAHQREVDCNSMDKEQLVILLNDLGQGVTD
jgi:hypothetical protein